MSQDMFDFGSAINVKKFTDDQFRLFAIIEQHIGKESAISAPALTRRTAIPDRKLRATIKELVEDRAVPICSCPAGYYIPATEREILDNIHMLLSWAFSTVRRAYTLKRNPHLKRLVGQLRFELEKIEGDVEPAA